MGLEDRFGLHTITDFDSRPFGYGDYQEWRYLVDGINIPNSVTMIADDAFKGCEKLLEDVRARVLAINP
jgi:hypothetical protein